MFIMLRSSPTLILALILAACSDNGAETPESDGAGQTTAGLTDATSSLDTSAGDTTIELTTLDTTTAPTTDPTDPTTDSTTDSTTASTTEPTTDPGPVDCIQLADCPAADCRAPVDCVAGLCVFENTPEGTPLAGQTPGDCARVECDGLGGSQADADADDLPDDGIACTDDTCEGVTPVHTPAEKLCYGGPPETMDVGACVAGTSLCDVDSGEFGPCEGEVVPGQEDCKPGEVDEDCDGEIDESGPSCVCGDGVVSEGEACDDGDKLDDACSSACAVQLVLEVGQGQRHGCARLTNGSVKCWGDATLGELGLGDKLARGDGPGEMGAKLPAVALGIGQVAIGIAVGGAHTCALLAGGRIKCWGQNALGQLGVGDSFHRGDHAGEMGDNLPFVDLGQGIKATALSAGTMHTCAVLTGGALKCWGYGASGELGLGSIDTRGDNPNDMGDALPFVDLGAGAKVVAVTTGLAYTCALLNSGGVKCWGSNVLGELGLGDIVTRGDGPGEMGDNLPLVNLGAPAISISAAGLHTCALLMGDKLKCWGLNDHAELGLGDTFRRGANPGEMGAALPAVNLGVGKVATAVSAHYEHTCARLSDGGVKCWGRGGRLGLGDPWTRGDDPIEMGDNLPVLDLGAGLTATAIGSATGPFTCAVLNDGSLKCWGLNDKGQLGLGDVNNRGDDPNEMGDALPRVTLFSNVW